MDSHVYPYIAAFSHFHWMRVVDFLNFHVALFTMGFRHVSYFTESEIYERIVQKLTIKIFYSKRPHKNGQAPFMIDIHTKPFARWLDDGGLDLFCPKLRFFLHLAINHWG